MPIVPDTLKKYPNPVFFETGTGGNCSGIRAALASGAFGEIHSVELNEGKGYVKELKRFKGERKVTLHLGDSAEVLSRMLPTMETSKAVAKLKVVM